MYSLEEFKKVYKDTSKDNILFQFYHEHLELQQTLKIIDELEKIINDCAIIGELGTGKMFIEKQYLLNKLKELKEGK